MARARRIPFAEADLATPSEEDVPRVDPDAQGEVVEKVAVGGVGGESGRGRRDEVMIDQAARIFTLADVLGTDAVGDHPLGVHRLLGHFEPAGRCVPFVATEPDGVRDHGMHALAHRWKIIEAHLGNVDDHTLVVALGQDPPGREGK